MWSPHGDVLVFRQGNAVMAARVGAGATLNVSPPVRMFDGGWTLTQEFRFDLLPDGKRLVMIEQSREAVATRLDVVLGWSPILEPRAAR